MPRLAASAGDDGRIVAGQDAASSGRARARRHLLAERHQPVRAAVGGRLRRRSCRGPARAAISPSSASRCIALRAVIRLTPNSAQSSASDGSAVARPQARDPLAQGLLDLAVLRARWPSSVIGRRRRAASGPRPRRRSRLAPSRRRGSAAPIAPAHVPSSAGHDLDLVERRRADPPPELVADRAEQQVGGRRDAAADDDPVGR